MLRVYPGKPLFGTTSLPGDKSLSHRAALFSALAVGESRIDNFQDSGVTRSMLSALQELGVEWSLEGNQLRLVGKGLDNFVTPRVNLNCGSSATTLRLLAGALAAMGVSAVLDGSEGLRRRPMGRILEPLRLMGVPIAGSPGDTVPLVLSSRKKDKSLHGIEYSLPVASAQVKSCLLLAGLAADSPLILHEPALSRDHSERMLAQMGCRLEQRNSGASGSFSVKLDPPTQPLIPLNVRLPGDISSAAFLIVAGLIVPGSQIVLENVGLNPTRTGILDALRSMGAQIMVEPKGMEGGEPFGNLTVSSSRLEGIKISGDMVVRMIDEFPIFAVAACSAHGITEVKGASELRTKESDRISALCQELKTLGAAIDETADGFRIHGPCPLIGGKVTSHEDHRLAMSLVVAGLAGRSPLEVHRAEIIAESFPEFMGVLRSLGAEVEEREANVS